jgi:hypothetical protein
MGRKSLLATIAGNARELLERGSRDLDREGNRSTRLRVELTRAIAELDRRFPAVEEAPDADHAATPRLRSTSGADIKWRTSLTTEELRQIIADRLTSTRRRR